MENMVAEVTLHNNIEMSKNCSKIAKNGKKVQKLPKIAKNCPKLTKIDKNCLKLKGYLTNYIYHTVPSSHMMIRWEVGSRDPIILP